MITSENYVENIVRTDCEYNVELYERLLSKARMLHAAIGLATESAELLDMLKKHIFYGKPFDEVNAKEECGDASWYIGLAIDEMKTTINEVITMNIEKLKLRYPKKFSEDKAINRDVNAERVLLERKPTVIYETNSPIKNNWLKDTFLNEESQNKFMFGIGDEQEYVPKPAFSKRAKEFLDFAAEVIMHIEQYTVPQYGDKCEDQITEWSIEDCLKAVNKRIARYGRQSRKGQQKLDFLKMAHEICIAADKYKELTTAQTE